MPVETGLGQAAFQETAVVRRRLGFEELAPAALKVSRGQAFQPIAPSSPWQNAFAERLIDTIRRECLDHMILFGEAHLRRTLGKYAAYYNESRIHRSLDKDAPFHRAIERVGAITSQPVLGGLHYQYCRI